jgi:hypothetical protein
MELNGAPIDRSVLAELCRDNDRFAAETDEWLARHKAEALARKNAADDLQHQADGNNALATAPVAEEASCDFTEAQFEAIAYAMAGLQREWQQDIERLEQKVLQTVVRLALPGERAEETMYALKDRVARVEGYIERRLAEVNTGNAAAAGAVATQHAVEVAELKAENRDLKHLLGDLCRKFDACTKEISDLKAQAAMTVERIAEVKTDVKSELQVLDAKQTEVTRLYTELRLAI